MSDDTKTGIRRKYDIKRTDGSSEPGGKHADCTYFVLDLEHDEFALAALKAYAKACKKTHPQLARDIGIIIKHPRFSCSCREASCPHSLASAFAPSGPSEMAAHLIWENDMRRGQNDMRRGQKP